MYILHYEKMNPQKSPFLLNLFRVEFLNLCPFTESRQAKFVLKVAFLPKFSPAWFMSTLSKYIQPT